MMHSQDMPQSSPAHVHWVPPDVGIILRLHVPAKEHFMWLLVCELIIIIVVWFSVVG